jgi:ribosomal protein S18 acetylase RimI-like enzyme
VKYPDSEIKRLQQTWDMFKGSKFYDPRSTVNPRYNFTEEYIHSIECIEELDEIFLILKDTWVEKDGSRISLIDIIFDPGNYNAEVVRKLFEKIVPKLPLDQSKVYIGINVDSRLDQYLKDLINLGFKEVIRLSEMEMNIKEEFDLSNNKFDFELRNPKETELRDVYEMIFKTQIKGTIGETSPNDKDYADFIKKEIKDIDLCTFVWDKGKIIAQITAVIVDDYVEIKELGVLPEYWRKGIAAYVTKLTLNKIFKSGFSMVKLHTDSYNRYGALNLYKKLGFEVLYESIRLRYANN